MYAIRSYYGVLAGRFEQAGRLFKVFAAGKALVAHVAVSRAAELFTYPVLETLGHLVPRNRLRDFACPLRCFS